MHNSLLKARLSIYQKTIWVSENVKTTEATVKKTKINKSNNNHYRNNGIKNVINTSEYLVQNLLKKL